MTQKRQGKPAAHAQTASAQLGGARAEFVASLGRKVEQARELLGAVEARPADGETREELRRRLHALNAAARMLHFDVMSRTLGDAEPLFERAAKAGSMPGPDVAELAQILDDLPALAWGESPRSKAAPAAAPPESTPQIELKTPSRTCVLFGSEMLAEALTDEEYDGETYECERSEDPADALELARQLAPDVVVVDGDTPRAAELVESLLDDPLTEPVPILVVGAFATPDSGARFVALGVNRTIPKPITPEHLRGACDEAIASREGRTMRLTLGEPTLEQLGERLADEVRQALVGSVDTAARGVRVPLGEGTEVLGAVWGAIARVREIVAHRTDGAVRFASRGPEGSIQLAPWLHDVARGDRATARSRGPAADVRLAGRRVVVADDDPGVTWFIADLLRTAGCQVFEALDGTRALELAYEHAPDLVVSDILMPGMDGFALCRALRRDVALRDVPVVLLSWKEDLLQRVRELGASAAAYLRKETDSRAIVARVREVLRPRARVETRIRAKGEVRGRLDGLTVRSLLELVCAIRPHSRVSVRDASFLYEVEIRDGAPRRVTRTGNDGGFQRGPTVLAAMLGVGAGRFTVADSIASVPVELGGTLFDQLAPAIAHARGAMHATTGARLMGVERVLLDEEVVEAYLRATPEPARELIKELSEGASPRAMLFGGGADPALVEDVLADMAARGAIIGVLGANGVDLLGPAEQRARAIMEGATREAQAPSVPPPGARTSKPPMRATMPLDARPTRSDAPPMVAPLGASPSAPPAEPVVQRGPSSLADAVMRELSDRSPEPGTTRHISSTPPPLVEPSNLKPRVSSNPPPRIEELSSSNLTDLEPSAPRVPAVDPLGDLTDVDDAIVGEREQESDPRASDRESAPTRREGVAKDASIPITIEPSQPSLGVTNGNARAAERPRARVAERVERTPLSSVAVAESEPPAARGKWTYVAVIAAAAAVVWLALETRTTAPPEPRAAGTESAVTNAPAPTRAEPTFADLPADAGVAPGEGLLDIVMRAEAPVKIDGAPRGRGPRITAPLKAGSHEVLVGAEDKPRVVEVRAARATRLEINEAP